MSKLADIKAQIVKELIQFINADTEPWRKPWITPPTVPINATTGKPYKGINLIHLLLKQLKLKTRDPRWITFLQAKEKGWKIRKGEKATPIVFYKLQEKEITLQLSEDLQDQIITLDLITARYPQLEEVIKKYKESDIQIDLIEKNTVKITITHPVLVYHYVFHASQIEGIPPFKPQLFNFNPIPVYEKLLTRTPNSPKILIDYREVASYAPLTDTIYMPLKEQFETSLDFYATLLHELSHSTMHEKRLNRYQGRYDGLNKLEHYAREELIAEIGAFIVSLKVGIPFKPNQSYAYVKSWFFRSELKFKDLYKIVKEAEKSADWIISEFKLPVRLSTEQEQKFPYQAELHEIQESLQV